MMRQTMETLTKTFTDVIIDLAFMFPDEEWETPTHKNDWLETTISYHGAHNGTLLLRCDEDFATLLAANLMGVDPDDQEAITKADDAVKELMNILCGQLVTNLHGSEEVIEHSIPQVRKLENQPEISKKDDGNETTLSVDNHVIQLAYIP